MHERKGNCDVTYLIPQGISAWGDSRGLFLKLTLTLVDFSELLTVIFGLKDNVEHEDTVLTLHLRIFP